MFINKSLLIVPGIMMLTSVFTITEFYQLKDLSYLGQDPPGMIPQVFAPGLISTENEYEYGSVFSADGTAFFYGVDTGGKAEIRSTHLEGEEWTDPKVIISHPRYSYNDPFLSNDESQLFYISDMPIDGVSDRKDYDIWFSTRSNSGWSIPENAGVEINTDFNEYYISFTKDGSMYFSSNAQAEQGKRRNYDIYKSPSTNKSFLKPVRLEEAINTPFYEADVFIAPDESYVIFTSIREDGLGQGDLYISFKDENGVWTEAKNMGSHINSSGHELCPFVTKDGKYFFYTSNKDIYWVDADILNQFK